MKRLFFFILFCLSVLFAKSGQIILIQTPSWQSKSGVLEFWQKDKKKWHRLLKSNIFVGKNGLAWGIGLHKIPKNALNLKKEGDGKAPAGIFNLIYAFGYEKQNFTFPYKVMSRFHRCVDDSNSKYYNHIIDARKVPQDYNSYENMKLQSNFYKLGIVVDHNFFDKKAIKKKGSCIFIHIKPRPTVGCTALPNEALMKKLISLLDSKKDPLLIQAPKDIAKKLFYEVKQWK